jgi:mono/diheme cytochrome c family protein
MRPLALLLAAAALALVALGASGCAETGAEQNVDFRPRAATRILILTPVPTAPFIPAISANATVAPAPTPEPSAQAPTPPSAEGVATAQVEIGEITRVPILENTPAPGEVGTVTAPGVREGEEVAVETPTAPAPQGAAGTHGATAEPAGTATPAATGSPEASPAPGAEAPAATARPANAQDAGATPGASAVSQLPANADGQQVYRTACAPCHGVSGEGMGQQFPRLEGNQVVLGDPQLVIQVILSGRRLMPAWRDQLSDTQIAAVATYIRSAWGNNASPVMEDMVSRQRQ